MINYISYSANYHEIKVSLIFLLLNKFFFSTIKKQSTNKVLLINFFLFETNCEISKYTSAQDKKEKEKCNLYIKIKCCTRMIE